MRRALFEAFLLRTRARISPDIESEGVISLFLEPEIAFSDIGAVPRKYRGKETELEYFDHPRDPVNRF